MMRKTIYILIVIVTSALFLGSCTKRPEELNDDDNLVPTEHDFEFISVKGGKIYTLHALKYVISVTGDFKVTNPKNRIDEFNSAPFRISLAAFISDATSLMIHAEEVANASGASNYSNLLPATWPNESFRSSGPQCLSIPAAEVEEEHDLFWLRQNGFEPSGNMLFSQYFVTTEDMNSEVVISILHRIDSCGETSEELDLIKGIQAETLVTRIE